MESQQTYQETLEDLRTQRRAAIKRNAPDETVQQLTRRIADLQIEAYKASKTNGRA
jgi:hypothetical protein